MDYIILVDGVFSSGKTTFIETLCGEIEELHDIEKDVVEAESNSGSKYGGNWTACGGVLELESDRIFLVKMPSNSRFDFFWTILAEHYSTYLGILVLMDSTRSDAFYESNSRAQTICAYAPSRPAIIAANKQDNPSAVTAEDIHLLFDSKFPIVPCIAKDRESVKAVTIRLLEEYLNTISD